MSKVFYKKDGDQWMAHYDDFVDLQQNIAGFGETKKLAKENLLDKEVLILKEWIPVNPLVICPICTKADGVDIRAMIKWNPELANTIVRGEICETCKDVMADGITLLCETCDALTVANTDKVAEVLPGVKSGEKYLIHMCPGCKPEVNPEGAFVFVKPE